MKVPYDQLTEQQLRIGISEADLSEQVADAFNKVVERTVAEAVAPLGIVPIIELNDHPTRPAKKPTGSSSSGAGKQVAPKEVRPPRNTKSASITKAERASIRRSGANSGLPRPPRRLHQRHPASPGRQAPQVQTHRQARRARGRHRSHPAGLSAQDLARRGRIIRPAQKRS